MMYKIPQKFDPCPSLDVDIGHILQYAETAYVDELVSIFFVLLAYDGQVAEWYLEQISGGYVYIGSRRAKHPVMHIRDIAEMYAGTIVSFDAMSELLLLTQVMYCSYKTGEKSRGTVRYTKEGYVRSLSTTVFSRFSDIRALSLIEGWTEIRLCV